jgi:hypothetical protein
MGCVELKLGRKDRALEYFERAVHRAPNSAAICLSATLLGWIRRNQWITPDRIRREQVHRGYFRLMNHQGG